MYNYSILPPHMREGMKRYLEDKVEPGSFLLRILQNDFMGACRAADDINQNNLFSYAKFLYSEAPMASYGSTEKVHAWLNSDKEE